MEELLDELTRKRLWKELEDLEIRYMGYFIEVEKE